MIISENDTHILRFKPLIRGIGDAKWRSKSIRLTHDELAAIYCSSR